MADVRMPDLVRFGPFELDLATADLHQDGGKIRLPEQQFQILEILLRGEGKLVQREEIRKRLWPNDTVVEFDRSINAAIKKLRAALGDSAEEPRFIETVARRGYRIMVEVHFPETPAPAETTRKLASGSLVGQRVSHYRVLSLLGGGGMGLVYKAEDLKLDRPVALKFLPEELASDSLAIQRFEREAKAASALNHPNICTIYGVEEQGTQPFIVMEFLEGESLREVISSYAGPDGKGSSPLPHDRIMGIAVQIAEGLKAAHEKGIIHRDIKPANVFVTTRGQVKILDFGLAKVAETASENVSDRDPRVDHSEADAGSRPEVPVDHLLTRTGITMGTAAYMSPEQVRGDRVDHHSDIFAFGAVLYEMLTGRLAFAKGTSAETMTAILNEDPPVLSQSGQNIPPGLQRVVNRCLEKHPEKRFQSSSDLAFALEALSESGSGPAVPVVQRSRPRWLWAVAGVVIAVAVLFVAWWWRTPPTVPVVESVTQLTWDPRWKDRLLFTDGSRIFFNVGFPFTAKIAQISVMGGPTLPIEARVARPAIEGLAHDGSAILVFSPPSEPNSPRSLWWIPLPAGEPRRLNTAMVDTADVFPDGRLALAAGKDLLVAENDGSNQRKLASFPGKVGDLWVSPDGEHILVGLDKGDNKYYLLEIASDGSGLRTLIDGLPDRCCANWSWDGNYVLYSVKAGWRWDLWVLPTRGGLFRRSREPVQLTNGPQSYPGGATASRDGKQIFAVGSKARGEAVRYDMESHQFLPLLSGISATDVTYSSDGKWVAYLSYPEHTLWRSRSDGSDRMQLTFPPIEVWEPFISPDGTKVVFDDINDISICLVDMNGGPQKKVLENAASARWSPDGRSIVFAPWPWPNGFPPGLRILDVVTGKISEVASSMGKAGGFWLDQETLGAGAVNADQSVWKLQIFDLRTQKWTDIVTTTDPIENEINSPDGKYVYFAVRGTEPTVRRVRVADHHVEVITSLKDFSRVMNFGWPQLRVAPDGSPTLTRDVDLGQIYALNVRWR